MHKRILLLLAALMLGLSVAHASRADRKNQEITDSSKPVAVKGGSSFVVPSAFNGTFETVARALKKADESVVVADREAGLIATDITVTGGWRQTGTRTVVSLIKESDAETTVKVTATIQKRFKALQVEPWSAPVLDKEKTASVAAALQTAIGSKDPRGKPRGI